MKRMLENRIALYIAVGAVAVGIATVLIVVSVVTTGGKKKAPVEATPIPAAPSQTATVTATRSSAPTPQKVAGADATTKLFKGIPQQLNVLGNPKARVTMIEFADLQCPFCREYTLNALPTILERYVRSGKVKLVFSGIAFIGPDSETALRAAYAAGIQSKLWNFIDLLYKNQGGENSGWVTDGLLRAVGGSIPGFDTSAMLAARSTTAIDDAITTSSQQAQSARVTETPTFFAGKTGGTLQHVSLSSLSADAFTRTLDTLLK